MEKGIEILRVEPRGYTMEDLKRYRDHLLRAAADVQDEWICWPAEHFLYMKPHASLSDERLCSQPSSIYCLFDNGLPRYWRREWLCSQLSEWSGKLPAVRFLPLDIVPELSHISHIVFLNNSWSSVNTPSFREPLRYPPYDKAAAFQGMNKEEFTHISSVINRTPNWNCCQRQTSFNEYPESCSVNKGGSIQASTLQPESASDFPLVTILMSIYNMQDTIGWAIRSVLAQTYTNWELLIGNDASEDCSVLEINSFSDFRIKVLQEQQNKGKAKMMNKLLQQAKGAFILELDGDDWLPPAAISQLVQCLQQYPEAGMASGNYGCWLRSRQLGPRWKGIVSSGDFYEKGDFLKNDMHPPIPRMYRKSALKAIGGWLDSDDTWNRVFEDIELTSRLKKHYSIQFIPEVLYHRVIDPISVSQRSREKFSAWNNNMKDRR